jgi:hypothetical protein
MRALTSSPPVVTAAGRSRPVVASIRRLRGGYARPSRRSTGTGLEAPARLTVTDLEPQRCVVGGLPRDHPLPGPGGINAGGLGDLVCHAW